MEGAPQGTTSSDSAPAAPPPPTSAPTGDEEHLPWVEEPARRLSALDADLRAGRSAKAAADARSELDLALAGDRGPALGLAEALSRLALAEAGLGRTDDAVWHWHEALSLVPGVLSPSELAAYGPPGALLAAHPLRRPGEAPAGVVLHRPSPAGPSESGAVGRGGSASDATVPPAAGAGTSASPFVPPRRLAGELPSPASIRAKHPGIPPRLVVEAVVDALGRVREPVVVSGRLPDLAVQALESLRAFRFAPATENGAPVAVLLEIVVDPPTGRPLSSLLSPLPPPPAGVDLASVEPLLRPGAGRAGDAARLAAKRWDEALNGRARSAEELGAALALRALAETGAGERAAVCRWQAAEVLSPALYDADLSPYGAAGALLDRNRWGSERWVVHGGVDRSREGKTGPAAAPPRPRVVWRERPVYPRFLRARRISDAVLLSGVVDEEGGLRQPDLRAASTSPNLDAAALDALCGFRFEPARAGGAPVASFYSVTMSFSPE